MTELLFMQIMNRLIELLQQFQAFRGDTRLDYASIVFLALTRDPAVLFYAVEQASHIRIARNHTFSDTATENAVRLGAAEDAQNVILRAGEACGLEEALSLLGQGVGGSEERDEELVFGWNRLAGRGHDTVIYML